jgi:hypothetical protein
MKNLIIIFFFIFSFSSVNAQGLMSNQANRNNPALKAYHAKQRNMEKNCSLCEKNWKKDKKDKNKDKERKQVARRKES